MTSTTHETPAPPVRALNQRRAQLEHRVAYYSAAVEAANGEDPCLGRELDATSSLLAQVRAELARLWADGADAADRPR
jgi:hypothetical protein